METIFIQYRFKFQSLLDDSEKHNGITTIKRIYLILNVMLHIGSSKEGFSSFHDKTLTSYNDAAVSCGHLLLLRKRKNHLNSNNDNRLIF